MKSIVSIKTISILIILSLFFTSCGGVAKDVKLEVPKNNSIEHKAYDKIDNNESYNKINENETNSTTKNNTSTFSIDVDTASYANVRRFITAGQMPPVDAVRIEEMINYFKYDYKKPSGQDPIAITTEVSDCIWNENKKIALVGIQGKEVSTENLPASNLVFLIDTSGSMQSDDKLELIKQSFDLLVKNLRKEDKVSIVTYAGSAGVVLDSANGDEDDKIMSSIKKLSAGGSTAGGQGIGLAYKIAQKNLIKGGNNRVILATDGDFNVGVSSDSELVSLIESKRNEGVFLSVLGFGTGNLKDSKMEQIADKGDGNYSYIDNINEAKKVFVKEFGGTIFNIAKDVKIQVVFNKDAVKEYRLIGYENRMLNNEDFTNDKKDAGEMGSGQTVTALYEIQLNDEDKSDDLFNVDVRYKDSDSNSSKLISQKSTPIKPFKDTSKDYQFSNAVAQFGMILRNSEFKGSSSITSVLNLSEKSIGADLDGYRKEFYKLVSKYKLVDKY